MTLLSTASIIRYLHVELRALCSKVPVVKLQDIVDEIDMIGDRIHAYLDRKTGRLITISSDQLEAAEAGDDLGSYFDWEQEAIQSA